MSAIKKNKFYEETLPEGYREALTVDAEDRRLGTIMTAATMIMNAVLFALIWFAYARPRIDSIVKGFSMINCVGLIAAFALYVILHELTHGLVYKLLTKKKLTFGLKPPVAYCGVPGIYAYRITALLSLLAPLTVFTLIFAVAFIFARDPFTRLLILALTALHLSGCVGDMYGVWLFMTGFKDPSTLRQDTGPKQIYYTKGR